VSALVVLSGGMDSVTALHYAATVHGRVDALSVHYGQRHARELDAARWQAKDAGVTWHDVLDLRDLGALLTGSALTDDVDVPTGHYADESMRATVVPNRNAILANIAAGVAVARGLDAIVLGVHSGDHAIYPDCRPAFVTALEELLTVANYDAVRVEAPFLHTDKVGILRVGRALGVDYSRTWTCYVGRDPACGACGSCVERREAFDTIMVRDPLRYVGDGTAVPL
jgi:7-cyano-7-deazaguanine synthase